MEKFKDDVGNYVRLTESLDLDTLAEQINSDLSNDLYDSIITELKDIIFKLTSYRELSGSSDYKNGVEEGLALAADMLERLLNKHS